MGIVKYFLGWQTQPFSLVILGISIQHITDAFQLRDKLCSHAYLVFS